MTVRTTEQRAPEVIASLIPKLTQLTTEQPTTAEIEEALLVSKALTRALFEWLAWRYGNHARATINAIPIESPAEREELDRIERAHPTVLHPVFAQLTDAFTRQKPA